MNTKTLLFLSSLCITSICSGQDIQFQDLPIDNYYQGVPINDKYMPLDKPNVSISTTTTISQSTADSPVFVIVGAKKRYLIQDNSDEVLKKIDPDQIQSIDVYKDESAISLLGDLEKNGVVVIFLKKDTKFRLPRRYRASKKLPGIIDI